MRPLRLELAGLRSYRARQEIDFRDKNLVAIVGNTGAGKSSILEAIVYALYNASTWDERSVEALIADGQTNMEVVFDFESGNRTWRVKRATCRGGYPPSQHRLICLSDETVPPLTRESAIKKEIGRILGLTYDGFKSAILLPQGKFQHLLTSTPKDRTGILKEVFRLDVQVNAIRKSVDEALARIVQQLDEARAARSRLYPDPAASAREAEERKLAAESRLSAASTVAVRHDEARAVAQKATCESEALTRSHGRLAEALTDDAAVLSRLVTIQRELLAKRDQLEKEQTRAAAEADRLAAALKAAEDQGEGLPALSAADSVLGRLKVDLQEVAAETRRLVEEEDAIQAETAALEVAAERTPELAESLAAAEAKLGEATSAVNDAVAEHNDVLLGLAVARRAQTEAAEAEQHVEDAREQLIASARALATRYDEEATVAEQAAASKPRRPCVPTTDLAGIEEAIRDARNRLEQRHGEAATHAAALAHELEVAEKQGEGLSALSTAASVLGRLMIDLPALADECRRLVDEEEAIQADAAALEGADARSRELAAAVVASEAAIQEATAMVEEAVQAHHDATVRLAGARGADAEAVAAERQVVDARAQIADLDSEAQARTQAHQRAVERLSDAQAKYDTARRVHATAHAAAGLRSGDTCPICTRPLPDGFSPPPGDDGRAQGRLDEAQKAVTEAQGIRVQAESNLGAARRALQKEESAAQVRSKDALAALGALRALLASADLAATDAAILAPLVDAERRVRAAQEDAQKARDKAHSQQKEHEADLVSARKGLAERRNRHAVASEAFTKRSQQVERELESLPVPYRPAAGATEHDVQDALRRLRERMEGVQILAERHEHATQARDEVARALTGAATLEAEVKTARRVIRDKESVLESRRKVAATALDTLEVLLPSANLAATDASNLAPLVEAGKALRAAQVAAQKDRDAALSRQVEYEGSLAHSRRSLDERRKRYSKASETLAQRSRSIEHERVSVPDLYRPPADAVVVDVDEAHQRLRVRLAHIRDIQQRQRQATNAREEAGRNLAALAKEEIGRVTALDQAAWPRLLMLAAQGVEVGETIGLSPTPAPAVAMPLGDRAEWASGMEECVRRQLVALQSRTAEANADAARATATADRALAEAGYGSRDELESTVKRLNAEVFAAHAEERKALSHIPRARALDERIGPATELRDALIALGRLLNDGKFVKFVVERRQQGLLAVSSSILKSMTRNRYAFAADFRVVDMVTNQARPVETLSGGETFLASLALALGLVELAGRGGGRVDSLILDEGFASLDSAALNCALDELACRAGAGKFVALVSHLGAVANMAPEVLYILQKDGSSIPRWRNAAEDDPELDEVDARLHRN